MTSGKLEAAREPAPAPQRSARSTLLNILGEIVYPLGGPVGTQPLLRALAEAGYEHHAARQAISRCKRAGWITGARAGRTAQWSLTTSGTALIEDGIRRVEELGREPEAWDGRWIILVTSIPVARRSVRQRMYRTLTWAGFGSPMPGVWISTHADRRAQVAAMVERLELSDTTVSFIGGPGQIGLSDEAIVARSWDLDAAAKHYSCLVERFSRRLPRTSEAALRDLLALDEELQRLPSLDPHLPASLAPRWSGREDASCLLEYRRAWLSSAREYWSAIAREED